MSFLDALTARFNPERGGPPPVAGDAAPYSGRLRGLDVRLPEAEFARREANEREFLASQPRRPCVACSQMAWMPVRDSSPEARGIGWRCRCGRPPMDENAWNAEQAASAAHEAEAAALAGTPAATRRALAAAHTRREEFKAELARLEAAKPKVEAAWLAAIRARDEARAALQAAPADGAQMLGEIIGEPAAAGVSRRELDQRLAAAEGVLEESRAARDLLTKRTEAVRGSLAIGEGRVKEAAAECIAAHSAASLAKFIRETDALAAQLADRRAAVRWLGSAGVAGAGDADMRRLSRMLDEPPAKWPAPAAPGMVAKFEAVLAALVADPAASAAL